MSGGALCGIVSIWGYCGYRLSKGGGHDSIIRTSAQPYWAPVLSQVPNPNEVGPQNPDFKPLRKTHVWLPPLWVCRDANCRRRPSIGGTCAARKQYRTA